jgi:hypothetical protein
MLLKYQVERDHIQDVLRELDNYSIQWQASVMKPSEFNPFQNDYNSDELFLIFDTIENGENEFKEGFINMSWCESAYSLRYYKEVFNLMDLLEALNVSRRTELG